MNEEQQPQRTLLSQLLMQHPIVRAYELRKEGIDPKTISRAVAAGELIRIARGLYQRPEADIDTHQVLAEAAKKVPRGVVAMVSALAYHELTDQMPRKVWMAVSVKDWSPSASSYPPDQREVPAADLIAEITRDRPERLPVRRCAHRAQNVVRQAEAEIAG